MNYDHHMQRERWAPTYGLFGEEAPRALHDEPIDHYKMRLASGMAKFTPSFVGKNLSGIKDPISIGMVGDRSSERRNRRRSGRRGFRSATSRSGKFVTRMPASASCLNFTGRRAL
jgi:hypothetical protein